MVTGVVSDAQTGEPLAHANVVYDESKFTSTDKNGYFSLAFKPGELSVSMIGYESQTIATEKAGNYNIKLEPSDNRIREAVVTSKGKIKYSRKNNPAVELM